MDRVRQQALTSLPLDWQNYGPVLQADLLQAIETLLASPPNGADWQPDTYPRSPDELPARPLACPRVLGITGLAQSGKDELAWLAQQSFAGVDRFAFSDAILPEVNAWLQPMGRSVDHQSKTQPELRRILQVWGSGRRAEDPRYWSRQVQAEIEQRLADGAQMVVVTGLRVTEDPDTGQLSLGDLETVRAAGGQVWNVHRPGNPTQTGHDHYNERALNRLTPEDFDGWVLNAVEGNLAAYHANCWAALHGLPQLFNGRSTPPPELLEWVELGMYRTQRPPTEGLLSAQELEAWQDALG